MIFTTDSDDSCGRVVVNLFYHWTVFPYQRLKNKPRTTRSKIQLKTLSTKKRWFFLDFQTQKVTWATMKYCTLVEFSRVKKCPPMRRYSKPKIIYLSLWGVVFNLCEEEMFLNTIQRTTENRATFAYLENKSRLNEKSISEALTAIEEFTKDGGSHFMQCMMGACSLATRSY